MNDESELLIVKRNPERDNVCFNYRDAAAAMGFSYSTLKREVKRGNIRRLDTYPVIAKEELLRYAREHTRPRTRTRKRVEKNTPHLCPNHPSSSTPASGSFATPEADESAKNFAATSTTSFAENLTPPAPSTTAQKRPSI